MASEKIRIDTSGFALVAEMYSLVSRIEAMKADNQVRESRGEALAWNGFAFEEISGELEEIARKLGGDK